jgi:hypothetical protein
MSAHPKTPGPGRSARRSQSKPLPHAFAVSPNLLAPFACQTYEFKNFGYPRACQRRFHAAERCVNLRSSLAVSHGW